MYVSLVSSETLSNGPGDGLQQQNVECEMPDVELEECLPPEPSSSAVISSSSTPSPSVQPKAEGMLLHIIAISAAGSLLILVAGGLIIVTVALVKKKKNAKGHLPREATNALYK